MAFSLEYSCRICLDNNALLNIYLTKRSHNSAKVACDEMMIAVFCLKVTQDDELPSKICRKCFSKLSSAYKLKKLAENSHKTLYEYFAKNSAAVTVNGVNEVYREILKEEIKVEYDVKEEVLDEKPQLTGYKTDVGDLTGESDGGGDDALVGDFVFDEEELTATMFVEVDENLQPGNLDKNGEEMAEEMKPHKRRSLIKERKKLKTEVKVKVRRKAGAGGKKERVRAVCPLCGKLVADMDTHSETHKPPGEKRRLPCPQCTKLFVSQSSRRRHVLVHHLGQLYFCQICNKNFKHGDQHMRMVHPVRPKPLGCPLCDKRFFTKAPLEIHLTSHTKERAFPCSVCGKGFRTHTDSEIHRRSVHEKERNIICQFCPKGFFSNADLNKHLCTHTKEKKYKCVECDKCFYRSNQLKLHLRRHRGIKDVQCTLCHKAFYTQGNLQTHMISHTKEKNYPCKYCGVKFGRTHHRDRHQRTAHESKPDKDATADKADQDHID